MIPGVRRRNIDNIENPYVWFRMSSTLLPGLASFAATVLEQVQVLRGEPTAWAIYGLGSLFLASLVYELASRHRQWHWERDAWGRLGAALGMDEERCFDAPHDHGFRIVFDRLANNDGVLPELTRRTPRADLHVVSARRRNEYGLRGLARPRTRYWTRIRLGPHGTVQENPRSGLPRLHLRRANLVDRTLHGLGFHGARPKTAPDLVVAEGDPAAFDSLDDTIRARLVAAAQAGSVRTGPDGIIHTWVGPLPDPETILARTRLLEGRGTARAPPS